MKKSYLVSFLALVLVALFMVSCVQTKPPEPVYGPPVLVRALPANNDVVELGQVISWEFAVGELLSKGRGAAPTIVKSDLYLIEKGGAFTTPTATVEAGQGSYTPTLEAGKEYQYYVTAEDSKGKKTTTETYTFSVTDPEFGAPEVALVSPAADAMGIAIDTALTWEATAGVEEARADRTLTAINVYYGKLSEGYPTTPVVLNGDVRSLPVSLDYSTIYVWKVVAVQDDGKTGDSGYSQFTTAPDPAAQPELPSILDFTVNGTEVVDGKITVEEGKKVTIGATAIINDHTQAATMSIKVEISDGSSNTASCQVPTQYASGCCDPYLAIYDSAMFNALPLNCGETTYTATITAFRCVDDCAVPVAGESKTFEITVVHNQPTLENATLTAVSQCCSFTENSTGSKTVNIKVYEDTTGATITGLEAIATVSQYATSDLLVAYEVGTAADSTEVVNANAAAGQSQATKTLSNTNWKTLGAVDGIWVPKDTSATITFKATDTFCEGETWTVVVNVIDDDYSELDVSLDATKFFFYNDMLYSNQSTLTVIATNVDQAYLWTYLDQADGGRQKYQLSSGIIMPPCNVATGVVNQDTGWFKIKELFPNPNGDMYIANFSGARATTEEATFGYAHAMTPGSKYAYHLEGQEIDNSELTDDFTYELYAANATGTLGLAAACGCPDFNGSTAATEVIFTNNICGLTASFESDYWPTDWLADHYSSVVLVTDPNGANGTEVASDTAATLNKTLDTCTGYTAEGTYTFKATHAATTSTLNHEYISEVTSKMATVVFDTTKPTMGGTSTFGDIANNGASDTAATITFYATDTGSNLASFSFASDVVYARTDDALKPATLNMSLVPDHALDGIATWTGTWIANFEDIDGATLSLTLAAKDRACNKTEATGTIFVDTVAPRVAFKNVSYAAVEATTTFLTPISTYTTAGANATYTFDLTDFGVLSEATILFAESEASVLTADSTSATYSFIPNATSGIATVTLMASNTSGYATITINATDVLGNATSIDFGIIVDANPPTVTGVAAYDVTGDGDDLVTVSFNEDVNMATLAGTITVAGGPKTFTGADMTKSTAFDHTYIYKFPSNTFGTGVAVKVEVAATVEDNAGNPMGVDSSDTVTSVTSNLSSIR